MTDEPDALDRLRKLRPDQLQSSDPNDPWTLARERDHLMSTIEQSHTHATDKWHAPAIYPRLAYLDEMAAIEFLTRAFGFVERREARMGTPETGVLAWLDHGDGVVMIGRASREATQVHKIYSPRETDKATCMLNIRVDDVDAHYQQAIAEGALVTMEINDAFYGNRRYEAEDPEGGRWHFHEPLDHVRQRRSETRG